MNRQTNAKQTKARIQQKRNKQRAESAENSYATRRKKYTSDHRFTEYYIKKLYSTDSTVQHGDHIWPRGHDMQHNFTILLLCQRLNTEEVN